MSIWTSPSVPAIMYARFEQLYFWILSTRPEEEIATDFQEYSFTFYNKQNIT